jgi:phosphatidylserine/phosphatidylglycerophosphate/cardiolipin synthase-like enzyme
MKLLACILLLVVFAAPESSFARHKKQPSLMSAAAEEVEDSLTPAPVNEEVCFSPVEKCDVKLVKFVKSAQKSLEIAIYDINLDQLVHQILLQARKIPVRVVVDKKQAKGNHSLVPLLISAGVNIRYGHQRGIMHNKFVIVDGSMVETGSFNHTNHATGANNENQVYLSSPKIVDRFKIRFEQIWEEGDPCR